MSGNGNERVVAQPVDVGGGSLPKKREAWARIAYFYPQYTLKQASELPVRDIRLLLKTAEIIEAERMFNLTQIAAAPHSEKGKGVKQLSNHFRKKMR